MTLLFSLGQVFGYFCLLIALLLASFAIVTYRKVPKPNRLLLIGCISMGLIIVGYMLSTIFFPPHGKINYFPAEFMLLTVIGINNITVVVPSYRQKRPGLARFTMILSTIVILFCLPLCIYTLYFSA